MKKRLIYWLAAIPLIFTACVEDEYAEGSRTPIQFTVNMAGDKGITRSNTVNDAWTNGDPVAVQMTSGGTSIVKKYKIVTGSTIKLVPDTDVEPFYWPNSSPTSVTVSAWYPYDGTKPTADNTNTSITDQSTADKYEAANLMETAEVTHTFNDVSRTFNLTFAHKMAKLIIVPYYYKNTLGEAGTSRLTSEDAALTTTKAINLCSGNNAITAYRNNRQFEVLVAPQAIAANTEIIQLSFGNSTFKYKSDAKTLVAGKTYTYNVNFNTAADSAISVTTTLTGATLTYDGNSHGYTEYITISAPVTCNGKTLNPDTDYEITGTTSEINAGTYTVTVRGKGQYSNNNTSSFTWTINQAHETQSISYAIDHNHVYRTLGDDPFTNTLTNNINHGTVTYTSSDEGVAEVDNNGEVTIKNTGSTTITATVVDANYTFEDNKNIASYTLTVYPTN